MLLLQLEENSRKPQYQQIIEQIQLKIEGQILPPGDKLPSTRRLADNLGIHRSTVANAYQELWALGFIDLRLGSCPRVRNRIPITNSATLASEGLIDWNITASNHSNRLLESYRLFCPTSKQRISSPCIDFSSLDMDYRLYPQKGFRSSLDQVIKTQGVNLLGYGSHAGFQPLRHYIAQRLQYHGISVTSDEIFITNGSQQGIDLILRMIAAPGKSIAVESPTYKEIIPLLRFCGLKPVEISMCHDGMDLSILSEIIQTEAPALVYTMPNFQNPTGVNTTQAHRERLLSLCERHRIPILEDGFEEEMKYFGKGVLPIKSMDKNHIVLYCGTFSKVLFPGIRIGWIAADRQCIDRLISIHHFSEISSSMILQASIYEFCQKGYYDRHISKMHRLFRKRMQTAIRALHQYISSDWVQWSEPKGGYLLWLKLNPFSSSNYDLKGLFAMYGVQIAAGDHFFAAKTADTYLRLSISTLNEEEIVEGIQRLSSALGQLYRKNTDES